MLFIDALSNRETYALNIYVSISIFLSFEEKTRKIKKLFYPINIMVKRMKIM
jgi:hypothetical protein